MTRKLFRTSAVTAIAALAVAAGGSSAAAAPAAGSAALRHYEGTVVSKDAGARVTANSRFERINGFAGLKVGAKNIESTVRRRDGRWIAVDVERSGGGGQHGGDDNPGGDDK